MLSSILIAQSDAKVGDRLAAKFQPHFREVRLTHSLPGLLQNLQQPAYAVIVDLELLDFSQLRRVCEHSGQAAVICTHRVADEEMWAASLEAGATDCCEINDVAGMLRAISWARFRRLARRAEAA